MHGAADRRAVADRICVAQIGAAHGMRGEVKLWSFTADPMAVADYGPLESEDGARVFEIETLRPAKDHLVARLAGVRDRNAAERLTNIRLYVPRERLPAAEAGRVLSCRPDRACGGGARRARRSARVVAIHDFGAGDLIELRLAGERDTVMLPFTATTVPAVDIAGGRIVIDPPQGTVQGVKVGWHTHSLKP